MGLALPPCNSDAALNYLDLNFNLELEVVDDDYEFTQDD